MPELLVQHNQHRRGLRLCLYSKDLPGKSDVVLPNYKTVVVVCGCCWHRPPLPLSHPARHPPRLWGLKFVRTIANGECQQAELTATGWKVLSMNQGFSPDLAGPSFCWLRLLPIYSAVSFNGLLRGGGTRPWAVYVREGIRGKLQPFVVKLFRASHLAQHPHLAAEVFGSVLAEMFELSRPEPALIEFSPAFRSTLDEPQQRQLAEVAPGLLFGCRLVESPFAYSRSLPLKKLEAYEMETIYGFDTLILNVDRRPDKPNLLMRKQEAILIDHELAFSGIKQAFSNLLDGHWEHLYQRHLFYPYLKARGPVANSSAFGTFTEYLRGLNLQLLLPYHQQLSELNCSVPDFDLLFQYLCHQKANAGQFETLLRHTIL